MKKYLVLTLILLAGLCYAVDGNFSSDYSLKQISRQENIPVKKIAEYLELKDITDFNVTLNELGVSSEQVETALDKYYENEAAFITAITVVGMSVVFISLIVVGAIIASLQHIGHIDKLKMPKKKKVTVETSIGRVTAEEEHISSNAIVAAITALHIHELEVEEQNKMLLTWKRQPVSMWKASNIVKSNRFFI